MKKYLFGLFAIALAIGFSAFTSAKSVKVNTQDFIWYYVEDGLTTDQLVFGDTDLESKDDAKIESGCSDAVNQPICAAGFTETVLEGTSVSSLPVEQKIRFQP